MRPANESGHSVPLCGPIVRVVGAEILAGRSRPTSKDQNRKVHDRRSLSEGTAHDRLYPNIYGATTQRSGRREIILSLIIGRINSSKTTCVDENALKRTPKKSHKNGRR
ncbi:hypothetical protein EVAR_36593_1 [Eumeta japonica]|uniref:Uncharacterized protein n=1 Tax=Eumeta variegata TaxID=151549 RepID=A0A4C1XPJ9_EUMVA|nr:hypothetical protein EVAR_36593_1 [Eumeta japonica]